MAQGPIEKNLIDLNQDQEISNEELLTYISANTENAQDLAKQLKEDGNEEIKKQVEECITKFYKENKDNLSELEGDDMKILELGKALDVPMEEIPIEEISGKWLSNGMIKKLLGRH